MARKHCGDVFIADNSHLDQARAQPAAVLFLMVERLLELIRGDQAVFDENFAESRRHSCAPAVLEPTGIGSVARAELQKLVSHGLVVVNQLTSDTTLRNLYARTGEFLLLYEGTGAHCTEH